MDDVFIFAVFEQVEVQLKIIATTEAIVVSIIKLYEHLNQSCLTIGIRFFEIFSLLTCLRQITTKSSWCKVKAKLGSWASSSGAT